MPDAEWLSHATVFSFGGRPPNMHRRVSDLPVTIEACGQRDGSFKWAVRQLGNCLSRNGEWEWEPQPSSRSDEFLADFRFDSKEDALDAIRSPHA